MKKHEVVRNYNFSDATLVTKGLEKIAFMERDASSFEEYGITSTLVEKLKTKVVEFSNRLTDIEALGGQAQATVNKEAVAEELRVAIRNLMSRVVLTYPMGSPKYRKFGTDTLSKQNDSDLFITAKRVVRVGNELLSELAGNGLSSAMLDNITALTNAFSDTIVAMKVEIGNRDIEQEDRVEAGNTIYTTLVKYTNTGQSIWESTDVAKFNDYVIYNTVSGDPDTPPSSNS
jgi:hypothetical protein